MTLLVELDLAACLDGILTLVDSITCTTSPESATVQRSPVSQHSDVSVASDVQSLSGFSIRTTLSTRHAVYGMGCASRKKEGRFIVISAL